MPEAVSAYLKTTAAWAPLLIRLIVGAVFIAHGAQKLFGAFGGGGIGGAAGFLASLGLKPALFWAWVLALAEFFGGLAILIGVFTGIASIIIVIDMIVAIVLVHVSQGFFLPGGFEYALTLAVAALSLVFSGPGALSVDRVIGWKF